MAAVQASKFKKVAATACLCFAIAALLLVAYLESLLGQSSGLIPAVGIVGLLSALLGITILLARKVRVTGVVLAVTARLFFVALGYVYGLMIRGTRLVREAFSAGMTAALREKKVSQRNDDSDLP